MSKAKIASPVLDLLEEFLHILQEEFERTRTLVKPFADWEVLTQYIWHYMIRGLLA